MSATLGLPEDTGIDFDRRYPTCIPQAFVASTDAVVARVHFADIRRLSARDSMLTVSGPKARSPILVSVKAPTILKDVDWIDAFEPTEAELASLERLLGLHVPEDLADIETSSRLPTPA